MTTSRSELGTLSTAFHSWRCEMGLSTIEKFKPIVFPASQKQLDTQFQYHTLSQTRRLDRFEDKPSEADVFSDE